METKKQTGKGILILDHGNQTFEKINSSLKVSDFSLVALDHIAQSSSALASHAHVLRSLSRVPGGAGSRDEPLKNVCVGGYLFSGTYPFPARTAEPPLL